LKERNTAPSATCDVAMLWVPASAGMTEISGARALRLRTSLGPCPRLVIPAKAGTQSVEGAEHRPDRNVGSQTHFAWNPLALMIFSQVCVYEVTRFVNGACGWYSTVRPIATRFARTSGIAITLARA
jgi:hypothetical protein